MAEAGIADALRARYEIQRELGAGGMARVYLASDLRHERKVAIKILRPELAAVVGAERFVREIRTIATLQHPHILGLIDSGEVNGTAYYVMPLVEGESLRDRLQREKQLPIVDAVRIATEIAAALDYAHGQRLDPVGGLQHGVALGRELRCRVTRTPSCWELGGRLSPREEGRAGRISGPSGDGLSPAEGSARRHGGSQDVLCRGVLRRTHHAWPGICPAPRVRPAGQR